VEIIPLIDRMIAEVRKNAQTGHPLELVMSYNVYKMLYKELSAKIGTGKQQDAIIIKYQDIPIKIDNTVPYGKIICRNINYMSQ